MALIHMYRQCRCVAGMILLCLLVPNHVPVHLRVEMPGANLNNPMGAVYHPDIFPEHS